MNISDLDQFKKGGVLPGYPTNTRRFFATLDDVHGALKTLIGSATQSIVLNMYGYDDDELNAILIEKASDPSIYVQISLDSSQAGGVHEKKLLQSSGVLGNRIIIGRSEHGAIMHLKAGVIDGQLAFGGSTNWSMSGEQKQDNELICIQDAVYASELRAYLDIIHLTMEIQHRD